MASLHYMFFLLALTAIYTLSESADATYSKSTIGFEEPDLNLVKTWDMESPLDERNTYVKDAKVVRTKGPNSGKFCHKVYDRTDDAGSVYHKIWFNESSPQFKVDTNYYASAYIKLANMPSKEQYIKIRLFAKVVYAAGGKEVWDVAGLPFSRYDGKWKQIGGDFRTPSKPFLHMILYLMVGPIDVNFYMDTVSLIELPNLNNNWREVLDAKIDTVRKSDVKLRLNIGSGFQSGVTKVEVRHIRHDFKFGTALRALQFIREGIMNVNYRNFVYKYFNWCGFENDFKWRTMEPREDHPKFGYLDQALELLEAHNISVRAHAIFWDRKINMPSWGLNLKGNKLLEELDHRMDYLLEHYKKKVYEWDVNNEWFHGHYFEDVTGVYDLLYQMFKKTHRLDKKTHLCINDYEIFRNGKVTSAIVNQAIVMRKSGASCIGAQSHLRHDLPIPVEVLQKRVEIACTAGVPVSITEMSVHSANMNVRADQLEKAFSVYFSQDCVNSVLLWGISDMPELMFEADAVLVSGVDFKPNKAGAKMIELLTERWATKKDLSPDASQSTHTFRAFNGLYNVTVKNGDTVLHEDTFYVSKGVSADVTVTV